jgi:hypothetical protein
MFRRSSVYRSILLTRRGRSIGNRIVATESGKMRDDEKERSAKENNACQHKKGDAAAPTGSFSSQRPEVSSNLFCRAICWFDHKKKLWPKPGLVRI